MASNDEVRIRTLSCQINYDLMMQGLSLVGLKSDLWRDLGLKPSNDFKLTDPLYERIERLLETRARRLEEEFPDTLEGIEMLDRKVQKDCGESIWIEACLSKVAECPQETDRWLESLAEPPTPEMLYARFSTGTFPGAYPAAIENHEVPEMPEPQEVLDSPKALKPQESSHALEIPEISGSR
ncbi:MAG: hypothetical protein LBR80_10460 [Deltaproteobacteria bacterium]|jgi:hypothetical protein|nr:hypothetical protein [Deltaproteobacteria bacterium]